MNGFGVAALLVGWLGRRPVEQAVAEHRAHLQRFCWMLLAQLVLFLGLTLVVRFPQAWG
jgi:hypothetical protein